MTQKINDGSDTRQSFHTVQAQNYFRGIDGPKSSETVHLDFFQLLSNSQSGRLKRQPPRLKLKNREKAELGYSVEEARSIEPSQPLASIETNEIAFQIAELIIRRMPEAEKSRDSRASEGIVTLDRMLRMFEHIYGAQTGRYQAFEQVNKAP